MRHDDFNDDSIKFLRIPAQLIKGALNILNEIGEKTGKEMSDFLSYETMEAINNQVEEQDSKVVIEEELLPLNNDDEEIIQDSITSYDHIRAPLVDAVHSQGYLISEVPKDGNCFFSSIAVLVSKTCDPREYSTPALLLRELSARYMRGYSEEFVSFFQADEVFNARANLYFYADRLGQNGEEVDHPIMQALADALRINITIHQGNTTYYINSRTEPYATQHHIFYDGRHYDALFSTSTEIIEEYDNFFNEECFLSSLDSYPMPVDIEPDNFFGLYGMMAMLFYAQHKFIDS